MRSDHQDGFTLIEVLVVLVIVAIVTAVVVLAFGDFGRGRTEKIRVETFARMIRAAQSQAIITPTILGLTLTSNGYVFYQYVTNKNQPSWQKMQNAVLSQPNAFKKIFDVSVKDVAKYDPAQNSANHHPAIIFLPSGYVTAFHLLLNGQEYQFDLHVLSNGDVSIKTKIPTATTWQTISS